MLIKAFSFASPAFCRRGQGWSEFLREWALKISLVHTFTSQQFWHHSFPLCVHWEKPWMISCFMLIFLSQFSLSSILLFFPAYETLSDEKRRREYDRLRQSAYSSEDVKGGHQYFQQTFDFNFEDMFRDFDIYSQNRHARPKRNFEEHFRAHQHGHNRHKRHFQGAFGAGFFEDLSDDMERMFTFDRHAKRTEGRFHGMASKQHCRTVTQRRGNMVTTYTDCTSSWEHRDSSV